MLHNTKGFTLIETLVYLALFALIIGGMVVAAYALFESSDRNQTKAMLQEEKAYLMGKIEWALSDVKVVSVPTASASGPTLTLTKYDGTTVTVTSSGTKVLFNTTVLNNTNTTISNLVFIHTYGGTINPESLEVGFTITAKTPTGADISQRASTTIYFRK